VSDSSLCFFASVFLFPDSYSYRRVSLSSYRPSPSLNPPPTSCQSSDAPLCAESGDLACTVGEVAVRGTGFPDEPAAPDSMTLEVTVATAVGSSEEVAGASQDMALALPSSHRAASPFAPLGTGARRLDDDVLQQFDATHRLSELTAAWGTLSTSFGEKLQVSFSEVLSSGVRLCFVLTPSLSLFLFSLFLRIIPASFSRLKSRKSCLLR